MKLTDDVKQSKQKHFKQYHTSKQKQTNKENLVRFLHRGKPLFGQYRRGGVFFRWQPLLENPSLKKVQIKKKRKVFVS